MTTLESTKHCPKCKHILSLSEFHCDCTSKDGLQYHCKECRKTAERERTRKKRKDPEWKRERQRKAKEWNASPVGRMCHRNYRDKHKERDKAHTAVSVAVLAGKIPKVTSLKCESCGKRANQYHHHNGYSEEHWLDVMPLCRACHNAAHVEMNLRPTHNTEATR